jgi:hypothetical protein
MKYRQFLAGPRSSVGARLRWRLLASVSAVALFVSVGLHRRAEAEEPAPPPAIDPGRWQIAFEGQLAAYGGGDTLWDCECMGLTIGPDYGADAGLSIAREMPSGWLASFGIRYGRSNSAEDSFFTSTPTGSGTLFYQSRASHTEQHAIIDFAVGRDVGLGLFGNSGGTSTLTAGVRIAHFRTDTDIALTIGAYYSGVPTSSSVPASIRRSFTGIGPRLARNGSEPIDRNPAFSFDWGDAGALLFGRRRPHSVRELPTATSSRPTP